MSGFNGRSGDQIGKELLANLNWPTWLDDKATTASGAGETTAQAGDAEHGGGHGDHGGDKFGVADLTLVTIVLFLALLTLLTRFAWRPILNGLEHREKSIADDIENARRANADAQANLKLYEQKLAEAAEQTATMLAEAKRDAAALKEQMLAEANEAAQAQRDRAVAEIKAAKDAAVRELAQKSAETAVGLAGSIIGRSLNPDDHRKLIEDSIQGFVKRV